MFSRFKKKQPVSYHELDISHLSMDVPDDIYIVGNGPSLNNVNYDDIKDRFLIGTNRAWLWGECDILIWRDSRITEELQFFGVPKGNSIWLAGDPAYSGVRLPISDDTKSHIDYRFTDSWKDEFIGPNIKWNGIIFHALAVAKFLNPKARIHLLGVDLGVQTGEIHHFFNIYRGFDQGFYKSSWEPDQFNYEKRLNMMVDNFKRLKKRGFEIVNHSEESRLTDLFGHTPLNGGKS